MGEAQVELLDRFGPFAGGWQDGAFHNPEGLASDSGGNIYVADETNHRVQKLSPDGQMLWKVGGVDGDGRPRAGTAIGEFMMHRGIAVDHQDNLYVADSWNHRVQKFDPEGNFRLLFGSYGNRPGQFGGAGPNGIAIDADGNIYVSDTHTFLGGNNRVQKFDPSGHFLLSFGRHGTEPGEFAGKIPLRGRFGHEIGFGTTNPEGPYGIAVGQQTGHVYVSDTDNSRIQVFDQQGSLLRILGEGIIFRPRQLCLDSQENVYIAGFHGAPDLAGLREVADADIRSTGPTDRFLWVLNREGQLVAQITADDADGLFDHLGGRHHAVTVSRADESLVYIQAGHHILKFRVSW
jgi:DNA-binding beta-propeller fold protein YncE